MNPTEALNLLRTNHVEAINRGCVFKVENTTNNATSGGQCNTNISLLPNSRDENMFLINIDNNGIGGDYYYPYRTDGDKIGRCNVPKNVPVGTLVFTGGMNGCALQVDDQGTNLEFMHCKDGCGQSNGNTLLRIVFDQYAGPNGTLLDAKLRQMNFRPVFSDGGGELLCYYSYYFITIKVAETMWAVYVNCIVQAANNSKFYRVPGVILYPFST